MVIYGGANVIHKKNTTVAVKHVCNFVKKKGKYCDNEITPQTHVCGVISLSFLIPSSHVNNEVLKFNGQIEKKMKICNNVNTWTENTLLSMVSI